MPLYFFVIVALLIALGTWVFSRFYQKHLLGENAPERTAQVTVLDMQTVEIDNPKPGEDDQEYWIYVQKGHFGPKREFQVGVHYYHALSPGDKGTLTYQGGKFLHFAMQRAQ